MLSRGIPWNMPLVTCIFFASLKARVYTENTSDAWHIPRYPTRKHCITSIYRALFSLATQEQAQKQAQYQEFIFYRENNFKNKQ